MPCMISFIVGSVSRSEGRWYCVLPRVGGGWNYFECHTNINGRYIDPSIIDNKYVRGMIQNNVDFSHKNHTFHRYI